MSSTGPRLLVCLRPGRGCLHAIVRAAVGRSQDSESFVKVVDKHGLIILPDVEREGWNCWEAIGVMVRT